MKYFLPLSLFILFFLSGCGFTLRGTESGALAPELMQMDLQYGADSAELGRMLQTRLQSYGVVFQDNADFSLALDAERSRERIVSVDNRIRAGEYELTLISGFTLSRAGESVISSGAMSQDQIYEADPLNAAAKTNEAELIRSELRAALAERIIQRLLAYTP